MFLSGKALRLLIAAAFACPAAPSLSAFEAGGGLNVFVPESLYRHGEGSISVETRVESGFGLTENVSMPFGIAYNQVYGLTARNISVPGNDEDEIGELGSGTRPWFYADSLLPFVQVKFRLPAGRFYIDAAGGFAANWNLTMRPLHKHIEKDLARAHAHNEHEEATKHLVFTEGPEISHLPGFGLTASVATGYRFGFGTLELSGAFRHVTGRGDISGEYRLLDQAGDSIEDDVRELTEASFRWVLQGFTVGLGFRVSL